MGGLSFPRLGTTDEGAMITIPYESFMRGFSSSGSVPAAQCTWRGCKDTLQYTSSHVWMVRPKVHVRYTVMSSLPPSFLVTLVSRKGRDPPSSTSMVNLMVRRILFR